MTDHFPYAVYFNTQVFEAHMHIVKLIEANEVNKIQFGYELSEDQVLMLEEISESLFDLYKTLNDSSSSWEYADVYGTGDKLQTFSRDKSAAFRFAQDIGTKQDESLNDVSVYENVPDSRWGASTPSE